MGALLPRADHARVACWTLGTLGGERDHLQAISPAACAWMGTSEFDLWISLSDASRGFISQVSFLVWNFSAHTRLLGNLSHTNGNKTKRRID